MMVVGLTAVAVLGQSAGAGYTPAAFSDVPPSHPFFEGIEWLAGEGVALGYPDGTFHRARR